MVYFSISININRVVAVVSEPSSKHLLTFFILSANAHDFLDPCSMIRAQTLIKRETGFIYGKEFQFSQKMRMKKCVL